MDKPPGWTSHDVVARVRRAAGQKAVGHAGTLDPLATGVLVVVLGAATKLSSYLMESSKTYRACVVLGTTTVTDDAEAPPGECRPIGHIDEATISRCLEPFVGEIDQVPPLYAAIKKGGKKLYALARAGVEVQPEPRRATVHAIDLVRWDPPRLTLRVDCASGTYIRSLARDIGEALGTGGYLHALRRTRSGSIHVSGCVQVDELETGLESAILPPDRAVLHLPAAVLTAEQSSAVRQGRSVPTEIASEGTLRLYGTDGVFVALASAGGGAMHPFRVFPEGV